MKWTRSGVEEVGPESRIIKRDGSEPAFAAWTIDVELAAESWVSRRVLLGKHSVPIEVAFDLTPPGACRPAMQFSAGSRAYVEDSRRIVVPLPSDELVKHAASFKVSLSIPELDVGSSVHGRIYVRAVNLTKLPKRYAILLLDSGLTRFTVTGDA